MKKIELATINGVIDNALESLVGVVKGLNDIVNVNSQEEADKHREEVLNPALDKLQEAASKVEEIIKDSDLVEQDYSDEDKRRIMLQLIFIDKKMDEINEVLERLAN